jgi:TfoX/Sxy family transcriptional regulator of competence genes
MKKSDNGKKQLVKKVTGSGYTMLVSKSRGSRLLWQYKTTQISEIRRIEKLTNEFKKSAGVGKRG